MTPPKGLPIMPWFQGDFLRSTRGWSVTAKGVYRELLDAQWDAGVLPYQPEEMRALIGATKAEWTEGWRRCMGKFPAIDDYRQNARLEEHRREVMARCEEQSRVGRLGGLASAQARAKAKQPSTDGQPSVEHRFTNGQANGQPSVNHPNLKNKNLSEATPRAPPTYMPVDFALTEERLGYAVAQKLSNPARTFQNFYDYWFNRSGAKGKHRDWDRAWQRWCREDADRENRGAGGKKPFVPAPTVAEMEEKADAARREKGL